MPKLVKFRRRAGHNLEPKKYTGNPPLGVDIVQYIAPGFAAFAATRFLTRAATIQISKRYPKHAKHAGAIASLGSFAAAWFGAHRVRSLEKYHHPIVVGAGLAAIQSLVQIYLPMIGWIVSDATPDISSKAVAAKSAQRAISSPISRGLPSASVEPPISEIPAGFEQIDAAAWNSFNDAFDKGGFVDQQPLPDEPPITPDEMDIPSDDMSELMSDNMGIFSVGGN